MPDRISPSTIHVLFTVFFALYMFIIIQNVQADSALEIVEDVSSAMRLQVNGDPYQAEFQSPKDVSRFVFRTNGFGEYFFDFSQSRIFFHSKLYRSNRLSFPVVEEVVSAPRSYILEANTEYLLVLLNSNTSGFRYSIQITSNAYHPLFPLVIDQPAMDMEISDYPQAEMWFLLQTTDAQNLRFDVNDKPYTSSQEFKLTVYETEGNQYRDVLISKYHALSLTSDAYFTNSKNQLLLTRLDLHSEKSHVKMSVITNHMDIYPVQLNRIYSSPTGFYCGSLIEVKVQLHNPEQLKISNSYISINLPSQWETFIQKLDWEHIYSDFKIGSTRLLKHQEYSRVFIRPPKGTIGSVKISGEFSYRHEGHLYYAPFEDTLTLIDPLQNSVTEWNTY